jgi:hypothetical protein
VREGLVLREALVADHDPRAAPPGTVVAEAVRVHELAADGLREPPVGHLLVQAAQDARGDERRRLVQPLADVARRGGAVHAQQRRAHDGHDVIGQQEAAVVAHGQHVRA